MAKKLNLEMPIVKTISKLINGKAGLIYNIFNYDKFIWKEDTKNKLILI